MGEIDTPALVVDLDAFDRNVDVLRGFVAASGLRLRAHAKTHKSAAIAAIQMERGGACGICCQKVSEAEALVAAGIRDVLVSNEVVAPGKIDRLARLARSARILVCTDDRGNVGQLSAAAVAHGVVLECLVEIDVGSGRCGVAPGEPALRLAEAVAAAPGLRFAGLPAYHGRAQHIRDHGARRAAIDAAVAEVARTVAMLEAAGLGCGIVAGAGTGSFPMEGGSGVYNELQCGSYIFMDADYGRVTGADGLPLSTFRNSLFVLTAVMSKTRPGMAVCDAGLKAQSVDSGLPLVFDRPGVTFVGCSDEHGMLADPADTLRLGETVMLVPGHCDPTVNLYDWYVGVRHGRVEALWPVTARGMIA